MPIYKIAELNILIKPIYSLVKNRLEPYLTEAESFDFDASADEEAVAAFCKRCRYEYPPEAAESTLVLTAICNRILESYNGFFFHSSCLSMDNEGYMFTAQRGVGKSTHTALWRKHFGDRVTMINDDKPIVRKIDGKFYVFGTPWMGKSNIGQNTKAPVKAVFVLQRGKENRAERVAAGTVFKEILEATVVPSDREKMAVLLSLLDEFFSSVKLFRLTCNTDEEAVEIAYNAAREAL